MKAPDTRWDLQVMHKSQAQVIIGEQRLPPLLDHEGF
jgi:hypothetical protein